MYDDCWTTITTANNERVRIQLRRGVKQGDPLSPLLFNSMLDPIIERINGGSAGINIAGENVAVLAFADDIILLSSDAATAQKQLDMLRDFLDAMGMGLSTGKCSTFHIKTAHKTWYQVDPQLRVGPELVPYANSEEVIRYLGVNLRPWTGLDKTTQRDTDTITGAANNIARMELKPHQKLELIRVYLPPRYIHGLVAVPPSMGALANIDAEVRRVVKDVYKLHPSTTDGIIYTDRNHGGLGLQRIETIVKLAVLRSAIKQMATDDPALRQLSADQDKRCDSYAKSLGIPWPAPCPLRRGSP
jgi:hypothetical protein